MNEFEEPLNKHQIHSILKIPENKFLSSLSNLWYNSFSYIYLPFISIHPNAKNKNISLYPYVFECVYVR